MNDVMVYFGNACCYSCTFVITFGNIVAVAVFHKLISSKGDFNFCCCCKYTNAPIQSGVQYIQVTVVFTNWSNWATVQVK